MQSRMDKYNADITQVKSRTQKNKNLYEDVRNSSLTEFDVNSNVSVIDNQSDVIDVDRIRNILDRRYNDSAPKRRSIELPDYDDPIIDEPLEDTKEYDINAILEKTKKGRNVDYNKERLKKVRETQFEILKNLDLEIKKVEDTKSESRKQEEENLMNLINTITSLEMKNRAKTQEDSEALALLDLMDEEEKEEVVEEIELEENEDDDEPDTGVVIVSEDTDEIEVTTEENKEIEESIESKEEVEEKQSENHLEETLSKLNIDISAYDDFKDVAQNDVGSIILKIIIFIIVIALVIGAVYILNDVLALGLF